MHDVFLRQVIADPDDDAPRLVYADWLEEHGGDPARAEFIRAEIEKAKLPDDHPHWEHLRDRAGKLWLGHGARWYGDLILLADHVGTARGFLESVELNASGFLKHAATFMARAPVRDVFLIRYKTHFKRFVRCPELGRVERLVLNDEGSTLDAGDAEALAASPYTSNLRELNLWNSHVGRAGCAALAGSPRLARLEKLHLGDNGVGDGGALALARAGHLCRLREVSLAGNGLTARGVEALAGAGHLSSLRELMLFENRLDARGARALAGSEPLGRLTALNLHSNPLGDAGVAALAGARFVGTLVELNLGRVRGSTAGVRALAAAPFAALRKLSLSANELKPAAFQSLASAGWVAGLVELRLGATGMSRQGLGRLLDSRHLLRPRYIDLDGNRFGDGGVEALARSPLLERVWHLGLSLCGLTDRSARALAASPYLGDLSLLSVWGNEFSPAAQGALIDRFGDACSL
jgi:uncharacterized protein (TIGR02996 family)